MCSTPYLSISIIQGPTDRLWSGGMTPSQCAAACGVRGPTTFPTWKAEDNRARDSQSPQGKPQGGWGAMSAWPLCARRPAGPAEREAASTPHGSHRRGRGARTCETTIGDV